MRVLTVARWYPSHDSPGRGSFVADLVRATGAAGVDVRVVSFDRVLVRGRRDERDAVLLAARAAYERVATPAALFVTRATRDAAPVPVARIPVVRRPGSDDPAALIDDHVAALGPFMSRLIEDWRPDVIHAHTGLPDGIVAATLGRQLEIPVIVTEHMSTIEAELADPVALERYRELLGSGVTLLGVSPSVAGRVAALLGVPADRIGVLPNPVADGSFPLANPAGRDADELLWVGSIGEHKGIDVLLRAFALVHAHRPGLHLRLVGGERSSGDRARLETLAADLGVDSGVSFDGWLARVQVAEALARAGLFVHPSPSETFGVAAAEAILTGLPVVARRSGGVPWIVAQSGGYGRAADGDDPDAFAAAIEAVLEGVLPVDAVTARRRLVKAVGEVAVARRALELYEGEISTAGETRASASRTIAAPAAVPPTMSTLPASTHAVTPRILPRVLLATGHEQAYRLVAELPADLKEHVVLVTPARVSEPDDSGSQAASTIEIVEAEPVPPPKPRPRGRSPLARLRRAVFRPAPTADELLHKAIVAAARTRVRGGDPLEIVAIDAPAAAFVARLGDQRARLAPGSLRWLADRWAAERDRPGAGGADHGRDAA